MNRMDFEQFKQRILDYLEQARELEEKDIEEHKNLSENDKIEGGYMIKDAVVIESNGKDVCRLFAPSNYTKWRTGDSINFICKNTQLTGTCTIEENYNNNLSLLGLPHSVGDVFDLHIKESELLSIFISTIKQTEDGGLGSGYMKVLGGLSTPQIKNNIAPPAASSIPQHLNKEQQKAVCEILLLPQFYTIQGPPGTGKTDLLAVIAKMFSDQGKDVLVVSNTHYAVNNALNKIARYNLPTYKIGDILKSKDLEPNIIAIGHLKDFKYRRRKSRVTTNGDVVGMTLCGVICHKVSHKTSFTPSVVLVDEASQISFAQAMAIGTFGASCNIFIGDNLQMPPIFHQNIANDPLSVSVFEKLQSILPDNLKTVLTTSYRMNAPICNYVSKNFYEPHGITLNSYDGISKRCVGSEELDAAIEFIEVDAKDCTDYNKEEALIAVETAKKYKLLGESVAIITPFRKQVNCLREEWASICGDMEQILIDTVERLQGQDVDVVILSMSVSDLEYYKTNYLFIENRNRLNVMVSRAKKKVVIIKSPILKM